MTDSPRNIATRILVELGETVGNDPVQQLLQPAGWSSAHSRGWFATVASRGTTNAATKATKNSSAGQ